VTAPIALPSRRLDPKLVDLIKSLAVGDRIKVVQTVRVGARSWKTEAVGTFRGVNYLATGITTERVKEDDLVVPTIHFTKDNGELSSISLDEQTRIEKL
jgi:hypothetical protein